MISVVQRTQQASVVVDDHVVGQIDRGMVVLLAIVRGDSVEDVKWMTEKLNGLRIFRNGEKHFDLDVRQSVGSILLVSNFTVAAATRKGRRPSLDAAADPEKGKELFGQLLVSLRATGIHVETGQFGADMKVNICNDGPATFILNSCEGSN